MTFDSGEPFDPRTNGKPSPHVQEVINKAHEHLRDLLRHRAELTKRIETVKRVLLGLSTIFDITPPGEP
jgi:hypothetical protein